MNEGNVTVVTAAETEVFLPLTENQLRDFYTKHGDRWKLLIELSGFRYFHELDGLSYVASPFTMMLFRGDTKPHFSFVIDPNSRFPVEPMNLDALRKALNQEGVQEVFADGIWKSGEFRDAFEIPLSNIIQALYKWVWDKKRWQEKAIAENKKQERERFLQIANLVTKDMAFFIQEAQFDPKAKDFTGARRRNGIVSVLDSTRSPGERDQEE